MEREAQQNPSKTSKGGEEVRKKDSVKDSDGEYVEIEVPSCPADIAKGAVAETTFSQREQVPPVTTVTLPQPSKGQTTKGRQRVKRTLSSGSGGKRGPPRQDDDDQTQEAELFTAADIQRVGTLFALEAR